MVVWLVIWRGARDHYVIQRAWDGGAASQQLQSFHFQARWGHLARHIGTLHSRTRPYVTCWMMRETGVATRRLQHCFQGACYLGTCLPRCAHRTNPHILEY